MNVIKYNEFPYVQDQKCSNTNFRILEQGDCYEER